MHKLSRRFPALLAFVFVFVALPALARPVSVFTPALRRVLQQMPADGKATLREVALREEKLDTIELEPMQVWAKDAKIIVYGPAGEETILPPPEVKYFKGTVQGEPESAIFISMSADGSIRGMVLLGERRWNLGSGVRKFGGIRSAVKNEEAPILIGEVDELDELADPAANWSCTSDHIGGAPHAHGRELKMTQKVIPNAGNVAGATYQLRLAVETDNEFCAAFGNNDATITTYIGDLVGKASVVYQRDLKTTLVLGDTHLRSTGADPWTVQPGANPNQASTLANALAQFGTYWHNNYSMATVPRSSAVFLSGKDFRGGKAWIGIENVFVPMCGDDAFCGSDGSDCGDPVYANAYAGAYAFNGSTVSVETVVPNPELTQNGVQYGLPNTNYNMLQEFMHELGHNANGKHTHCVALTPAEKALYGVSRNFVDECAQEGGCFTGTPSVPAEKGTTMSYCHLFTSSGFPQSRFLFGKAGEPSAKMLTLLNSGLELATPDATITAQTEPVACSAGRTASVPTCTGCSYAWTISGGTITSATSSASITYTPSLPSVTLTVTVLSSRGCGITASKTITTSCPALSPPTHVVATASSTTVVGVSWTAAAGAATYNVYRSTNGVTYNLAGSTTGTTLNDTARTADTAYLYKVRAVNGGESGDSNIDLATTTIFNDDPLVVATTPVRVQHITQLRTAVNAVRTLAGLGAGTYTDPGITAGNTVRAVHITDLRTAIDAARSALSLTAISYGEGITAQSTVIRASHQTELRNGVK